jgi:P-type Cu+ transporter
MPVEQAISTAPETGNLRSAPITELQVTGMTCGNCARHVGEALRAVAGVQSAQVDLERSRASVRWAKGMAPDVASVIRAVMEAGFEAKTAAQSEDDAGEQKLSGWKLNMAVGLLGTIPLMLGEWVFSSGLVPWFRWISFVLASAVQVVAGGRFYRGAWLQAKVGNSNMDTLVALGSTTAFLYSAWALFTGHGGHLYFMEAAAIITLVSIGHWMESRVSVRASSALRQLLDLAPAMARRREPDGTEDQIPAAALSVGDIVILKPGERLPSDGKVIEGGSAVDESMLTGESMPIDKAANSGVYAGTLNLNGRLIVRVTATGEETALAHIIAAVQRAQNSRANIQRLGDRVSSVFVPIVVAIAVAAGLWWGFAPESARHVHAALAGFLWPAHPAAGLAAGFIIAASVLIIACPCAMGLATPAAIMAGSNAAAARGILIRDGVALEKAGEVTAVLFDKTGTLTQGKPQVAEVWQAPRFHEIRRLAASLGQNSTHPISQAVVGKDRQDTFQLRDWQEIRGAGVVAQVRMNDNWQTARLGSLRWLTENGVELAAGQDFTTEWSQRGASLVGVAVENTLAGLFAVQDGLKIGAREVVIRIQEQGLKTYMVTGDNRLTASRIAAEVGIPPENVFAEVRPEQKADFLKRLQQQGEKVAFVGDGINDAPALEQADLGIAVSRASDIAREAADIILLNSEIEAVPESLGLARATLRTIKQNLFWAFFYNAIGIPLAALGFMSPILCAAAMGLSDLVVIGNALRLRTWRLKRGLVGS